MVSDGLRQVMLAAEGCGELGDGDFRTGRAEHPVCGDVVALQVRLEGDCVADLAWRASGCPACMAVTATAWQALRGGSVDEASRRLRDRVLELGGLKPFERHAEKPVLRAFGRAVGVEQTPL